jgi:hypothetical protein
MVSNLGLALLLVAAASSAFAAAPGVDEAAIKAFVADITALSGKSISAFDGKGAARPAQSASIRRAGPLDFSFSIKTRQVTGKISAPQPIALSFRPNEPGMGAGTFMVVRHGLVENRSVRCSGKYASKGSVRAVDLVCTRMSPTGGFTPGEIVSKMRWEIAPQLFEMQLMSADGTVNAIYRTAR